MIFVDFYPVPFAIRLAMHGSSHFAEHGYGKRRRTGAASTTPGPPYSICSNKLELVAGGDGLSFGELV